MKELIEEVKRVIAKFEKENKDTSNLKEILDFFIELDK